MILPDKYTPVEDSFIGSAALVLRVLSKNQVSVDQLWNRVNKKYQTNNQIFMEFPKFVELLVFMYTINLINYSQEGVIFIANN